MNFTVGNKSATSKPHTKEIAPWISFIKASWSLHLLPNAALDIMEDVNEEIFSLILMMGGDLEEEVDDLMDSRRCQTSSSLIKANERTFLTVRNSNVHILGICLQ